MRNKAERRITKQGDARTEAETSLRLAARYRTGRRGAKPRETTGDARAEAETSPGTTELCGALHGIAYDAQAEAETSLDTAKQNVTRPSFALR